MNSASRVLFILLSVVVFFEAPLVEAATRRGKSAVHGQRRGRASGRPARRASRGTSRRAARPAPKPRPPADPRIAAREKFVREVADRAFATCVRVGQAKGKNEIDQNYESRRCLVQVLLTLETSVASIMQKQGKPEIEYAEHQADAFTLSLALKANTQDALNEYDSLNLLYSIVTAKQLQQDLLFPLTK